MAFAVTRFPEEPIVLVQLELANHEEASFLSLQAQLDRIASTVTPPLMMIIDLRKQDIRFCDVLLFLECCADDPRGTAADPRIHTILLGEHLMLSVLQKRFKQRFRVTVRQAHQWDEALHTARAAWNSLHKSINDS